jgi:hypothetical protein
MHEQIFARKIRMKNRINEPEIEALIQGYLEGSLTEKESARLRSLLTKNPEIVDSILSGLRDDLLIRTVVADWMMASSAKSTSHVAGRYTFLQWMQISWELLKRKSWVVGAMGTAAAAVLVAFLWFCCFGRVVGTPVLAEASGAGISLERAGRSLAPAPGEVLRDGDILRTSGGATAVIRFAPEKTSITLLPGTEFKLTALSRGKVFDLAGGRLEASVARQRLFRPMLLKTPQAEARVIGTRFTLTATSNSTRLEVTEGKVRFTRSSDEQFVQVNARHYAVAAANYELAALPVTGSILRQYWTNVPAGYSTIGLQSNPRFPAHPDGWDYLGRFATPGNWGANFGARICGYLQPPATGDYTFWIAAGYYGDLFLSSDDNPGNRRWIAHAENAQPPGWINSQGQKSAPITLKAGKKYYIEALQIQATNRDAFLAVAWQGPDRPREIIPGKFLAPLELTK